MRRKSGIRSLRNYWTAGIAQQSPSSLAMEAGFIVLYGICMALKAVGDIELDLTFNFRTE